LALNLTESKLTLLNYFEPWTLAKGRDYFEERKVTDYSTPRPDEVHGKVSGSQGRVYRTKLFLDVNYGCDLQLTECSCPVGEDCKHSAALYIKHLQFVPEEIACAALVDSPRGPFQGPRPRLSRFESPPAVALDSEVAAAIAPLPADVRRSFTDFASSLKSVGTDSPAQEKKTAVKEIIYIINLDGEKDEPNIEIRSCSFAKDGALTKGNRVPFDRMLNRPPEHSHPEDVELIRFWASISRTASQYWSGDFSLSSVDPKWAVLLMTKILETRRCYFSAPNTRPLELGPELSGELAWEEHKPDLFRLSVVARDGDNVFKCLRASCLPWYVDASNSIIGPTRISFDAKKLNPLFTMRDLTRDEAQRLPVLLSELGISAVVPPPPVSNATVIRLLKPTPHLEIRSIKAWRAVSHGPNQLVAPGESIRTVVVSSVMPESSRLPYKDETGATIIEKPDTAVNGEIWATLGGLGFGEIPPAVFGLTETTNRYFIAPKPTVWSKLDGDKIDQLRADGWQISTETESACLPIEIDSDVLDFQVSGDENWWFSLALDIDVNGKSVSLLPVLVSAIRNLNRTDSIGDSIETLNRDGKFVGSLPDGSLISIPFERIRSILVSIQELIERGLDPIDKLPTVDAADLFDETLSRSRFIGSGKILKLVQSLKSLKQIEPIDEPTNFKTELRHYQKDGLAWLQFLARQEFGGILADDMGLGKTIQLLAHICLEKQNGRLTAPYLVLCPTSVLPNWLSESEKFAPDLKVVSFHGLDRHANLSKMKDADLVVTTYPILARDLTIFEKLNWHGVALDEAQAIKNHKTKMAQAARSLTSNHKFCLTGTPVENHLGELWSQFQFLLPGLLGDAPTFKNMFRDPIEKLGDAQQRKVLARRVKPFILRRAKSEVAQELPDKTVIVQHIELEGPQRDLYETVRLASLKQVRDEIAKKGFKHSQIMILDALLKMRQVCCDPRLVKLSAAANVFSSAKLDALIEMLEQLTEEGHKVLVFSQFTSMLALIEERLLESNLEFVKLTGDTKDRAKPVREFQEGTTPIFLISLKAGGTGLNLTQADVVIHYDPWWNPAVEEQATDRAHRIGQTKKVFVYKLISKGTIEQRMVEMQERKRAIAASVYDEDGNFSLKFSEQDLDALLQPIDDE
jgi:superfamily II DNA or RNA helicase